MASLVWAVARGFAWVGAWVVLWVGGLVAAWGVVACSDVAYGVVTCGVGYGVVADEVVVASSSLLNGKWA